MEEYVGLNIFGSAIMEKQSLTLHETMEIHEMLNFKTVCMTKSKMMEGVVFDQELKALLEKDAQQSIDAVNQLRSLLTKSSAIHWEV